MQAVLILRRTAQVKPQEHMSKHDDKAKVVSVPAAYKCQAADAEAAAVQPMMLELEALLPDPNTHSDMF